MSSDDDSLSDGVILIVKRKQEKKEGELIEILIHMKYIEIPVVDQLFPTFG